LASFEPRSHRLAPRRAFTLRALRHLLWGSALLLAVVTAGTVGYRVLAHLSWVDAFLNASMILGGMGPVDRMETDVAKVFAALYALFSGLVFVGIAGLVLAPWLHRFLHRFHLDEHDS
jgi:hypothetical protein